MRGDIEMSLRRPLLATRPGDRVERWVCWRCSYENYDVVEVEYDSDGEEIETTQECASCSLYDVMEVLAGLRGLGHSQRFDEEESAAPRRLSGASGGSGAGGAPGGDGESKGGAGDASTVRTGRSTRDKKRMPNATHLSMAYRLWTFNTKAVLPADIVVAIRGEQERTSEFKQLLGRVLARLDSADSFVSDVHSGQWTPQVARRPLTRAEVSQLIMAINTCVGKSALDKLGDATLGQASRLAAKAFEDDDSDEEGGKRDEYSGPQLDDEFARLVEETDVDGSATVNPVRQAAARLSVMFFGEDLKSIVAHVHNKVQYFDSLFMNIELATSSGVKNTCLDVKEFYEGMCMLGMNNDELPVPIRLFMEYCRVTCKEELNVADFRVVCLQLASPFSMNAFANAKDMLAGTRKVKVRDTDGATVRSGAAEAAVPGGIQMQSPGDEAARRAAFQARTENTIRVKLPSGTKSLKLSESSLSEHFVLEFRRRMQFLYDSAEGTGTSISWGSFFSTLLLFFAYPLVYPFRLKTYFKTHEFNVYPILAYLLGVAYWFAVLLIPMTARLVSAHHSFVSCTTEFELYYPCLTFCGAALAISSYNGYFDIPLHPSTFRALRMRFRVQSLSALFQSFETGREENMSVYSIMQNEGLVPPSDNDRDLRGADLILDTFQHTFVTVFTKRGRIVIYTFLFGFSLALALLPGFLRAGSNQALFETGNCTHFFSITPSGSMGRYIRSHGQPPIINGVAYNPMDLAVAAAYVPLAFIQTFLIFGFMVRLYVQYAEVHRRFIKLSALTDPVSARKARPAAFIDLDKSNKEFSSESQTLLHAGGRLGGYLSLKHPANVRAWSKMRLFMLQKFSDELGRTQIFLAFAFVGLLLGILLLVAFIVLGEAALEEAGIVSPHDHDDDWQWEVMGFLDTILVIILAAPLFQVLRYGVSINSTLHSHRPQLLRLKYELHENVAMRNYSSRDECRDMAESQRLIGDLLKIIAEFDIKVKVLGVAITATMVNSVFSSAAVAAVSSIVKTFSK